MKSWYGSHLLFIAEGIRVQTRNCVAQPSSGSPHTSWCRTSATQKQAFASENITSAQKKGALQRFRSNIRNCSVKDESQTGERLKWSVRKCESGIPTWVTKPEQNPSVDRAFFFFLPPTHLDAECEQVQVQRLQVNWRRLREPRSTRLQRLRTQNTRVPPPYLCCPTVRSAGLNLQTAACPDRHRHRHPITHPKRGNGPSESWLRSATTTSAASSVGGASSRSDWFT